MDPRFNIIITIVAIVVTFVKCRQIKNKPKRIIVIMAILLAISTFNNRSIYWFLYWDGPYHGQVVDADTGEPIEGAAVAGIWEFEGFVLFIASFTHFANAKETVTDANGKFKLPLTFAFTFWPFSVINEMDLLVFKPGYDSRPPAIRRKMKRPERIWYTNVDGKYYVGRYADCKIWKKCLVKLNKAKTVKERQEAYSQIMGEYPGFHHRENKNKNIIKMVENESRHVKAIMRNKPVCRE